MGTDIKAYKKLFPQKHISTILSSLHQEGAIIRKKTNTDREDWITRRLHHKLVRIPIYRDGPLDARLQPEIPSKDPNSNYPGGRIDILIACAKGAEVYFAIEAKRLRVQYAGGKIRTGNNEYVEDGMMRFVSGQYAPHMRAGAMLGYVFDGKTDKARSGIDKAVQNKAVKLRLKPPKKLVQSTVLPSKPVNETRHVLGKRDFTIYHVLVAV